MDWNEPLAEVWYLCFLYARDCRCLFSHSSGVARQGVQGDFGNQYVLPSTVSWSNLSQHTLETLRNDRMPGILQVDCAQDAI